MSSEFEGEMVVILNDFKADRYDLPITLLRIEKQIVKSLGMGMYHANEEVERTADFCSKIDGIFDAAGDHWDE